MQLELTSISAVLFVVAEVGKRSEKLLELTHSSESLAIEFITDRTIVLRLCEEEAEC